MKKRILFVIDSLVIGGAEKSLVSLLNLLDFSLYEVDLLMFKKGGEFERFLPNSVNILPIPKYFESLKQTPISRKNNIKFLIYRLKTSMNLRINPLKRKSLHSEQVVYKSIKNALNPMVKKYDVAIAYSQGMPTYYVANKVSAAKKIAWINTDYATTFFDKEFDYESYKNIDKIIAVSNHIQKSVSKMKKEYEGKIEIILDIIDPSLIYKKAEEHSAFEFAKDKINILTVGRLVTEKSLQTAIEVACLLKSDGYKFKWFVIGDGPEKEKLQELVNINNLNNNFILLGKKLNPYSYMKNCDIYVQTSIREGFGLTVSEAKILKRPIVCTSFPTAKEIIRNNIDGLIVDHDIESIYNGIKKYLDDINFRRKILYELETTSPYNSLNQLEKFYQLIR